MRKIVLFALLICAIFFTSAIPVLAEEPSQDAHLIGIFLDPEPSQDVHPLILDPEPSQDAPLSLIKTTTIQHLPNGGSLETAVEEQPVLVAFYASASTKSGTKTITYRNSAGTALWYVKVTGSFSYNGSTSSCSGVSAAAGSYSAYWAILSKSATRNGHSANATATAAQFNTNFEVIATVLRTATLSCSANETLS